MIVAQELNIWHLWKNHASGAICCQNLTPVHCTDYIPRRPLTLSIHRFVIAHHHIQEIIWWRLRPGSEATEATRVHSHRSLFVIGPWHWVVITINGLNFVAFRGFWGRWRGPLSSSSLFNLTLMQNTLFGFRNLEFDLLKMKM